MALALADGVANAAVIYDNGSPDGENGNDATRWVQAEDFTLAAGGSIGGAGVYIAGLIGNWDSIVDYFLFADNAGTPGVVGIPTPLRTPLPRKGQRVLLACCTSEPA